MSSYAETRERLETYFDRTAAKTWEALTSDAPVSKIRQTVREGRDEMRMAMLSSLPDDLTGARVLDAGAGAGQMTEALAMRGATVVAADISPSLLDVAQRRTGVEGQGDRGVAQRVRRQLLPLGDLGGAGQAAHELAQRALVEPRPAGGGQQRAGRWAAVRARRAGGEVDVEGGPGGRRNRQGGAAAALAHDGEYPVATVVAEVGDIGSGELVDAQPEVQQQPRGGRGAQPGRAEVGVGGGEERAGLVAVETDGGGVVGVDLRAAHRRGGVRGEQVVVDEVVVEAGHR